MSPDFEVGWNRSLEGVFLTFGFTRPVDIEEAQRWIGPKNSK